MTEEFITSKEIFAHILNQTNQFIYHLPAIWLKQHEKLPMGCASYDEKLEGKPVENKTVVEVYASVFLNTEMLHPSSKWITPWTVCWNVCKFFNWRLWTPFWPHLKIVKFCFNMSDMSDQKVLIAEQSKREQAERRRTAKEIKLMNPFI